MKKSMLSTVISGALLLTFSSQLLAVESSYDDEKPMTIGVGTFAVVFDAEDDDHGEDEFAGVNLSATYAINDHMAIRAQYYRLEHDDLNDLDLKGFEANIYGGTGLLTEGFKAYGGGGLYSEKLAYNSYVDESFSGVQFSGGIGYNWPHLALDFGVSVRSVGDYADFVGEDEDDVVAVSSSLTLAFRF